MTALVTVASPASPLPGRVLSHGQAAQDRSSVPGMSRGGEEPPFPLTT
jgi:hypothetical protein